MFDQVKNRKEVLGEDKKALLELENRISELMNWLYQEGNMVKYTMGASTNYNEIFRLRKTLAEKFPEAFIIAFKNGKKYDVNQAIREFKQNRNR